MFINLSLNVLLGDAESRAAGLGDSEEFLDGKVLQYDHLNALSWPKGNILQDDSTAILDRDKSSVGVPQILP